jgi:SAM-dependent methyltransferase
VDLDEIVLDIARRECAELGFTNTTYEAVDVTKWNPETPFDVVYARFLLSHLSHPGQVLAAIRRIVRPGGVMIVEDTDFRGHFSEPDCPALRRYVDLFTKCVQARGGDPNIGPRLPRLLREAGIVDVRMRVVQPAALEGGIKRLTCVTLETISEAVLSSGLATAPELREVIEELWAFAGDPDTVLGGPRVIQAWGRLP